MHIKLTEADITEFQEIYKKETGQEISREKAAEYAQRVISLIAWIVKKDVC